MADDVRVPDTHITDDMARRVVGEALDEWRRHQDHVACAEYPVGKHPTFERMVANALSAALARCTVTPEPDLIELPKFQGCTNSNPDLCACGESALMCAACDEEIEDNSRAYTMREKCKPWLADNDPDQEWQDVWWHFSCDERAAGSQVGDQQ